jgi:hypothetical protein
VREFDERAFDEHLDNYGDPNPGEIWGGPGDDWYPGDDDDDETNADGDNWAGSFPTGDYDNWPVEGIFPDIPDDDPGELTPDYLPAEETEAWRDEPDYDNWPEEREFPS